MEKGKGKNKDKTGGESTEPDQGALVIRHPNPRTSIDMYVTHLLSGILRANYNLVVVIANSCFSNYMSVPGRRREWLSWLNRVFVQCF